MVLLKNICFILSISLFISLVPIPVSWCPPAGCCWPRSCCPLYLRVTALPPLQLSLAITDCSTNASLTAAGGGLVSTGHCAGLIADTY